MSFVPDIFTTGFAGWLFYFGLGIFENGRVAEAIAF
jgi:membrane-bound acyltransferase YfiQ involved in biofilm formation